jgi:hypothetical protein
MTDVDLKILARIKKLHNMAESARDVGNLAEADSFMEAVTKTIAAHNMDMSALNVELHDLTDPLTKEIVRGAGRDETKSRHKNRPVAWIIQLAEYVAMAHYCNSHYGARFGTVFFYGRKTNVAMCRRVFEYLRDMAERVGWDAYVTEVHRRRKEHGSEAGSGQWRLNWMNGFAEEVGTRYRAMRTRVEADKGLALVLVKTREEAVNYSDQFLMKPDDKDADKGPSIIDAKFDNYHAQEAGRAAARKAELNANRIEDNSSGANRKQLNGGN